jgi:alpha-beta hydrolase superfamily lysophospholipase
MKKSLALLLKILSGVYLIIAVLFYFYQEAFLFIPEKLTENHQFSFNQDFEELNIKTTDNIQLNGVLFKARNSKGLIFYLHGNAGSIASWGAVAQLYTALGYDVFILDYRGYGKSKGEITNQKQLFEDNQLAYDIMKKRYNSNEIIILGYSIGTGLAAKLAATNKAKMLILQAPYYNLADLIRDKFIATPTFLLKYKFETNKFLEKCTMPIVLFHGNADKVIYYESSIKLFQEYKATKDIKLITLIDQGHNGMSNNTQYQQEILKLLK